MRFTVILLGTILLAGCSLSADVHSAQLRVAHFHSLLNAGNADQIIAEAPGMKWPSRGPTFRDYLLSVHRKLGFCGSWRMLSYHEHFGMGGGAVRINADTHCDNDNAQESFVFSTGDLKLRGYAITSRILVTS